MQQNLMDFVHDSLIRRGRESERAAEESAPGECRQVIRSEVRWAVADWRGSHGHGRTAQGRPMDLRCSKGMDD